MRNRPFVILMIILILASFLQGQPKPVAGQSPIYLRGNFLIVWGDGSAQDPRAVERYFLMPGAGQSVELIIEPKVSGSTSLLALNRQKVILQGTWLEQGERDAVRVEWIQLDESEMKEPEGIFGPQPWVSVMCKFADYADEPKDLAYFQGMYSSEYPGLDHYWREQSFDLANLEGSGAFGWYTLPYSREHYVPPSGYMDWGAAAEDCTAVADADIYFPDYVGINLMFNAILDCCAWGGSWYLCRDGVCQNWRMTWEPPWGYENIGVIAHETGHGFGLPHSSGDYGQVYDNAWDVMSDLWSNGNRGGVDPVYGTMGQHTISYHKNLLEWIDSEHMIVVPTGTRRTIHVEQIALPQMDEALGVKVLINDSQNLFYTIESRRFEGYDSWLPGEAVIIHKVDVYRSEPAHVIDIDGDGDTGDEGAMWRVGETFEDEVSGILITVDSATATGFIVTVENKFVDLSGVVIDGPTEGQVGEEYTFSADVSPINASEPITYIWEATGQIPITHTGGVNDVVALSWMEEGTKTITVTALNPGSVVADTHIVSVNVIQEDGPESVNISGPVIGIVGIEQVYQARVEPITTTLPITYVWQASGQETVTQTGGLTDTVSYTWYEPGEQIINLLAMNAMGEVATTFSTTVLTPELEVVITGTTNGYSGLEYVLTALVSPITATQPLTYVWTVGELVPVTHTGGLSDTLTLTLGEPGTYIIALQVRNAYTSTLTTWEIVILERIFIPFTNK